MKRLYWFRGECSFDKNIAGVVMYDEAPNKFWKPDGTSDYDKNKPYNEWVEFVKEAISEQCECNYIHDFTINEMTINYGEIKFEPVGKNLENEYIPVVIDYTSWYNEW